MVLTSSFSATNLSCIREQRQLFTDVSFALEAGDVLFVEGENGAGKSSLLRLLAGLATPATGEVKWREQSIQSSTDFLNALHYIGHANGIKLGLTVDENLNLMARHCEEPIGRRRNPTRSEVLSQLKLTAYQHTLAKHLSAGQRRRIALAKLLLFPKFLWILDEPLTALDAATQRVFLRAIDQHAKEGGIVIVSSHQPLAISQPINTLRLPVC